MTPLFKRTIAFSLVTFSLYAQNSGGGTIQGIVKDSSGAVIPGAKLRVNHMDTGTVTTGVTNIDGFFAFPPAPEGKYLIRCEASGMKAWEQPAELEVGQTLEVNAVLTLGQNSETVTVAEAIPLVNTTDPTASTTLDAKRIKELPINGRDLNTLLAEVTPGVEQVIDVNGFAPAG